MLVLTIIFLLSLVLFFLLGWISSLCNGAWQVNLELSARLSMSVVFMSIGILIPWVGFEYVDHLLNDQFFIIVMKINSAVVGFVLVTGGLKLLYIEVKDVVSEFMKALRL